MEVIMVKKIIDGKRYDTATAMLVATYSNGLDYSDFKHCEEELYRTPRGNWFICGSGGPLSAYSEPCGGGYCGSKDKIRPLTPVEAMAWLERHGETDALEENFQANVEDA